MTTGSEVVLSQITQVVVPVDLGETGYKVKEWDPVGESFGRQNLFFLETQHR